MKSNVKRFLVLAFALCMVLALAACGTQGSSSSSQVASAPTQSESSKSEESSQPEQSSSNVEASSSEISSEEPSHTEESASEETGGKTLVAYFSCTGNTEGVAGDIAAALGADTYEIVPEQPYTEADLNYSNSDCRANQEQNDDSCRPAISGSVENMDDYDTIFIGYPIWWGQAPKIIYTFMESYDFSGKTIVPFCTSASSGVGSSATNLHGSASDTANWLDGTRLSPGDDMESWLSGLGLA